MEAPRLYLQMGIHSLAFPMARVMPGLSSERSLWDRWFISGKAFRDSDRESGDARRRKHATGDQHRGRAHAVPERSHEWQCHNPSRFRQGKQRRMHG